MRKILKKRISLLSVIILVVIIITIGVFFGLSKLGDEFFNTKKEIVLDFESRVEALNNLNEANINKYGWLQVQGTTVDIPILTIVNPSTDYSHGWISSNSVGMKTRRVLVGHNVLNVSSSPMVNGSLLTDFEDLMAFVYYDFAKENMYLSFTEKGIDNIYVIYAIGFYDYDYDRAEGLNSDEEIKKYIDKVKENSIYDYDVEVTNNDDLLTIKTCTRYFGNDEKQQFVIEARKLRNDETTLKYNVKKSKLYKEYKLVDSYNKADEL